MKRKRIQDLATEALQLKLDYLRKYGMKIEPPKEGKYAGLETDNFKYLLDVCLAHEKLVLKYKQAATARRFDQPAESHGEYDFEQLQGEKLQEGLQHRPYTGPIKIATLPEPKSQGVVASRDILKGEMLCTSVPSIIVPNLASSDDPSDLIFSDLSRAEMTAKLIIAVSHDASLLSTLHGFHYAGKADTDGDVEQICTEIIRKYTWAIDHPATMPQGRPYHGRFTKVAGHAFTIDGWAGRFNHSCVPNATMVSYGVVQFFIANCSITKGTELCVSYGFDPLASVRERRAALMLHAEFECDCPLCLYELGGPAQDANGQDETMDYCQPRNLTQVVSTILRKDVESLNDLRSLCSIADCNPALVVDALCTTSNLLRGQGVEEVFGISLDKVNLLKLLSIYPKLARIVDDSSAKDKESLGTIFLQSVLVCLMLICLEAQRPPAVGIPFGDLYRMKLNTLANHVEQTKQIQKLNVSAQHYLESRWWHDRALEYTDCF